MTHAGRFEEERPTGRFHSSSRMPVSAPPPPPPDDDTTLGLLMTAVTRLERTVGSLSVDVGTLTREVTQLGKDAKEERPKLVKHAAANTSNRMALLLGALFTLWEAAAPILHAISQWGQH